VVEYSIGKPEGDIGLVYMNLIKLHIFYWLLNNFWFYRLAAEIVIDIIGNKLSSMSVVRIFISDWVILKMRKRNASNIRLVRFWCNFCVFFWCFF